MAFTDIDLAAAGAWLLGFAFPAVVSVFVWLRLRRERMAVRVAAVVLTMIFPFLGILGWLFYPNLRARIAAGVREFGEQARAQYRAADAPPPSRERDAKADAPLPRRDAPAPAPASVPARAQGRGGTLDTARLLSPDIAVRFGAEAGGRKLNIPKVVE